MKKKGQHKADRRLLADATAASPADARGLHEGRRKR